ncbi:hypothetical protein C8A01DRAFT_32631 [Parachaetomium inaequale]|uniref:DUF7779 domain-containing protein n=1 Tax=Parachaetomium inaequale TaxID=2588326 RepID=A0AAN6SV67_9PEZI|nr:hypothetical protein C8A01DRAFT_32631 [Parachaetomium inaequale]
MKLQWTSFAQTFKRRTDELQSATNDFEKEVELASHQEQKSRHAEILADLTTIKRTMTGSGSSGIGSSQTNNPPTSEKAASTPGTRTFCSCLVHAIGGMGKKEVALEYTYRFRHLYTHIFWVRAGSSELLAQSYEDIFGSKVQTTLDQWLLIFDNAEDVAVIRPFWPASPSGSIIVTSQNPQLSQLTKWLVPLHPLPPSDGARLVQSSLFRGGSEQQAASKLSGYLGGLPLAIVHFVGYIAKSQCPIDAIADNVSVSSTTRAYEHSLATVWDLALNRLSPEARLLMDYIAFLDPDHLPVDLFSREGAEAATADKATGQATGSTNTTWEYWEPRRFNEAVAMLCQRNLVERYMSPDGDCLKTHRILQQSLLQRLDKTPDHRQAIFGQVVSILRRSTPQVNVVGRSDDSQFAVFAKYLPQLLVLNSNLTHSSKPKIRPGLTFVELAADFGFYCRTQDEPTALPVLRTAEAMCADLAADYMHPPASAEASPTSAARRRYLKLQADVLSLISIIVKPRGKAGQAEAFTYLDRIIEIRRLELEGIPPGQWSEEQATNHHSARVDKALTLCYADRVEEAAPFMEEAEAFYASVGNELPARANAVRVDLGSEAGWGQGEASRSRLGDILFTIGDVQGAMREHEVAFAWRLSRYGYLHDETLGNLFCLAVCRQHLGDAEGAENDLRTVLREGKVTEEWREADVYRVWFRLRLVL